MKRIQTGLAPARALRAVAGVALVLFCAGAARAYEREETFQKTIPLEGAKRISVTNAQGDVKVIGEKGRTSIACEYVKHVRGKRQDEADRLFALMDVSVTREGTLLTIAARYPEETRAGARGVLSLLMAHYGGLSVDLNVTVPADLPLKVVTASGDVQVASMSGEVEIASASGDIEATGIGILKAGVSSGDMTISSVAGKATLGSASGDIEAHQIGGDAAVQSASGDMQLSAIGGDLTVSSTSGDVEVEGVGGVAFSGTSGSARFGGVRGSVEASAASGDIEVIAVPDGPADYELRTSSGIITIDFERILKNGFALKAQTTSGDISVSLPIKVTKVSRHYLAGVVRGGRSLVALETASGDIVVNEPEE